MKTQEQDQELSVMGATIFWISKSEMCKFTCGFFPQLINVLRDEFYLKQLISFQALKPFFFKLRACLLHFVLCFFILSSPQLFLLTSMQFLPVLVLQAAKKSEKNKGILSKSQFLTFLASEFYFQNSICLYNDFIFSEESAIPITFPSTHQHPEHNF